jgi:hypothetical protein
MFLCGDRNFNGALMPFKEGHPRYGGMQKGQHLSIKREAFERLRTLAVDAAGDVATRQDCIF